MSTYETDPNPHTRIRRRTARKYHYCPGCTCGDNIITPGDTYLEHTIFPGHDSGYADAAGHPVRSPECAACAHRYGRGHLLHLPYPLDDLPHRMPHLYNNSARLTAEIALVKQRTTELDHKIQLLEDADRTERERTRQILHGHQERTTS